MNKGSNRFILLSIYNIPGTVLDSEEYNDEQNKHGLYPHRVVVRGRDAHSLNIHANKDAITNCIRCSKGKPQDAMQLSKKGTWPGLRSQEGLFEKMTVELRPEATSQAKAKG